MTRTIENLEGRPLTQENANHLAVFLRKQGIKKVLFDLDDTLTQTIGVFDFHINRMLNQLAMCYPALNPQLIRQIFEDANNRSFENFGVDPTRWTQVLTDMSLELGFTHADQELALATLENIYQTPIPPVPYALDMLNLMKTANIGFGIVTHADTSWTERKFHWLHLDQVMDFNQVYCIETRGHKTSARWLEAFSYFGMTPSQVMVVGDSLRSDICPTLEVGVGEAVWIQGINTWSAHRRSIPDHPHLTVVNSINDILLLGNIASYDLPQGRAHLPTSFP